MLKVLFRTSFLSALSVVARGLSLLIVNKLLASVAGPGAYVVLGNFQNAYVLISSLAAGSTAVGITKYTAEHFDNQPRQQEIWRAALSITVVCSAVLAIFCFILAAPLSYYILGDEQFKSSIRLLSLFIFPTALHLVFLAILNGRKKVGSYVIANVATSIILVAISCLLVKTSGVQGIVASLALYQALTMPLTLYLCFRERLFSIGQFSSFGRLTDCWLLGKYSIMALISAITGPLAQYAIRTYLAKTHGVDSAGLWEAVNRLSGMYLLIVISPLTVYYLPRFSEIRAANELKREIKLGYLIILPCSILSAFLIYFYRIELTVLLFSEKFVSMNVLMGWQCVGDVLKIGSWLLGFLMLARGLYKPFIATELIFATTSVILSILFVRNNGPLGAQMAYALNYAAYWGATAIITHRHINSPASPLNRHTA